jgi:hypothetical protein
MRLSCTKQSEQREKPDEFIAEITRPVKRSREELARDPFWNRRYGCGLTTCPVYACCVNDRNLKPCGKCLG